VIRRLKPAATLSLGDPPAEAGGYMLLGDPPAEAGGYMLLGRSLGDPPAKAGGYMTATGVVVGWANASS
jgi:hypothetical protein